MKYTKSDVRYTDDHGKSSEQCSKCRFFLTLTRMCQVVKGPIDPAGWCMKYLVKR